MPEYLCEHEGCDKPAVEYWYPWEPSDEDGMLEQISAFYCPEHQPEGTSEDKHDWDRDNYYAY